MIHANFFLLLWRINAIKDVATMKIRLFKPHNLSAEVHLPASKSISNRALLLAALSKTPLSALTNISDCDDTRAMLTALGSESEIVDVGAAGTAMRFLTAYFCLSAKPHVLTGSPRMLERPIGVLVEALRSMGADISYEGAEGFPPLRIAPSHLHGGRLELRGDVSSQYVSALLMIAPMLADGLALHLTGDIASKPYIEMTMAMMRSFGAEVNWQDERTICVAPKCYHKADYMIESDWSAASYWYSIVALSDNEHETATLKGLFDESLQGDSGLRALFSQMGVQSMALSQGSSEPRQNLIRRGATISRLDVDFARMPDLVQTFVVACALKDIPFRFTGVRSLRIKETDRIAALQAELDKLGISLANDGDDILYWQGSKQQAAASVPYLQPAADAVISTYADHRMAMAFAPAAMVLGSVEINDPDVVSKSYPLFWEDLKSAGFEVERSE